MKMEASRPGVQESDDENDKTRDVFNIPGTTNYMNEVDWGEILRGKSGGLTD